MTLRDRCKQIWQRIQRDQMLRQGSPVETLMEFVMSENGRTADDSLKDTLPLVIYFGCEQDRSEFLALMHEAKPGLVARPMP